MRSGRLLRPSILLIPLNLSSFLILSFLLSFLILLSFSMLSILLRLARGAASLSAADDGVPGSRIEKVEKGPKDHDGEEPVACALQALPHFGKVELAYHDGKDH